MSATAEGGTVPQSVWRGTALLTLGRVWASACAALTLLLLARHLPGAEFGRYTFYLAVFVLLEGLADFGTSSVAIQRGASSLAELAGTLGAARRIRGAMALAGFAAVALGAFLLGEKHAAWIGLAALYPLSRTLELTSVVYQREIAWGVPVLVRSGAATLRVVLVLVLWRAGVTAAAAFLLAHAAGGTAGHLVLHRLARSRLSGVPRAAIASVASMWKAVLPLGLAGICQHLYFYVDNAFVRAHCGEVELGHYNAAVRVMSLLITISAFATAAALPWLARRHREGDLAAAAARLALPLFLLACVTLGWVWPWSGELLGFAFGPAFAAGADSLRWLIVATLIVYAGSAHVTAVVAAGRMRTLLGLAAAGLGLNLAGNAWLVPAHGLEGAAAATAATELLVNAGAWLVLGRAGPASFGRLALWIAGPLAFLACARASGLLFGA